MTTTENATLRTQTRQDRTWVKGTPRNEPVLSSRSGLYASCCAPNWRTHSMGAFSVEQKQSAFHIQAMAHLFSLRARFVVWAHAWTLLMMGWSQFRKSWTEIDPTLNVALPWCVTWPQVVDETTKMCGQIFRPIPADRRRAGALFWGGTSMNRLCNWMMLSWPLIILDPCLGGAIYLDSVLQ